MNTPLKRSPHGSRPRLSRDMAQLVWLAGGLAQSGSRLERTYWFERLQGLVEKLLMADDDDALNTVLNRLADSDPVGHDTLMDTIESVIESASALLDDAAHDLLLLACPVLAWSRYAIATPVLSGRDQQALVAALQTTTLVPEARVTLLPMLIGPDQVPREFSQLARLTRTLSAALIAGEAAALHPAAKEETSRFLSDTRYLVALVAVPKGAPVFRWQAPRAASAPANTRQTIERLWAAACLPLLAPLLPGCHVDALLPEAFHAACAAADRAARPHSVAACVSFLSEALNLTPDKQRAVIGPFYAVDAQHLEEFRIGFGPRDDNALYHGVVWPLLGNEDSEADLLAEIEQGLRQLGISDIVTHEHPFPMEYCEDCGGPLYADADGELAHLEMPEDASVQPTTLH